MQFTRQQLDAIEITRLGQDLCVAAGPGSGRTTVLVERFRRLVTQAGIAPQAVETTLRAGREIREGNAVARPADAEPCRYCTYQDVCRNRGAAGMGSGAGEQVEGA